MPQLPTFRNNRTYLLPQETFPGGKRLSGLRNVILDGGGSGIIEGGTHSLRLNECVSVTIRRFKFRGAKQNAIFATYCTSVLVEDCEVWEAGQSGILTGRSTRFNVIGCDVHHCGGHGVYLSESGDFCEVKGNQLHHNRASGLQLNARQAPTRKKANEDGLMTGMIVFGNVIYENGELGGAAINCMGLRDSTIIRNQIRDNLAGGIALWEDDGGAKFASLNNTISENEIYFQPGEGRYCIQLGKHSHRNIITGDNKFRIDDPRKEIIYVR